MSARTVGHSSEILFVISDVFPDRTHARPLGRNAHLAWCGHADKNNGLVYLDTATVYKPPQITL
jgi:hypothetical protein